MSNGLYAAAFEPLSGKSLVVLGLMELLSRRVGRLGFFRPVIRSNSEQSHDNDIELVRNHFGLSIDYKSMFAATYDEARSLESSGRRKELLNRILEKYKSLQRQCDFVLCEGTDFTGVSAAFEFEFNAKIANHLGCPLLVVGNGSGKTASETVEVMQSIRGALEDERCSVVASIINRVPKLDVSAIERILATAWRHDDPVFIIPEVQELAAPTIQEVAEAIGARYLSGDSTNLDREAIDFKIAAMQLSHFLEHVEPGSLVIVPGDRSDVILGCLATVYSESFPNVSGLVLTGGLEPDASVTRLIGGLPRSPLPVLLVEADTYETAVKIGSVRAHIEPNNTRKTTAALRAFEEHVDVRVIEQRIEVSRSTTVTPLMFEYDLIEKAKRRRRHIVLPEGTEERILRASEILIRRNAAEITLLGNVEEIHNSISLLGLDLAAISIVDPSQSDLRFAYARQYHELRRNKGVNEDMALDRMLDVSYFGTMMVYNGDADGMVSGAVHTTAHTIRPAFEIIKTRSGARIVSSVFFMCLPDRVLVYGDCAINPNPTAPELADIATSSADTADLFGVAPRVAMLSYSTGESGSGQDVDLVREATRLAQSARPDLLIEGPIQYDAAIDPDVARTKAPNSKLAGCATVLIFPDLNTGNNTYKAVQRSSGALAVGPVLQGLKKPVNDLSRGCTIADIVNTVAITAVQAQTAN